jgi:hypothetical protein
MARRLDYPRGDGKWQPGPDLKAAAMGEGTGSGKQFAIKGIRGHISLTCESPQLKNRTKSMSFSVVLGAAGDLRGGGLKDN